MSLYSRPRWAVSPWWGLTSLVPFGLAIWLVGQGANAAALIPGVIALGIVLYAIAANAVWSQEQKRLAHVPTPHRETYVPVSRRSWKTRGKVKT